MTQSNLFKNQNTLVTILVTIAIGVIVFYLSEISAKLLNNTLLKTIATGMFQKNVSLKFFMILYSLITILFINNGSLKGYGFTLPKKTNYLKLIGITFLITIASLILGRIIMVIIMHIQNSTTINGFPKQKSFWQMFFIIWIWSSLAEEVFVRGLLQTILMKTSLIKRKIFNLNLSVLISGLLFGSMHLVLLLTGMSVAFVVSIFIFTTSLGIVAAQYRETSESIVPAFLVHFFGNVVGGSIPYIVMLFLK